MKKKIIFLFALAVITVNFSSCVIREHDGGYHEHHHHHHHHHGDPEVIIR